MLDTPGCRRQGPSCAAFGPELSEPARTGLLASELMKLSELMTKYASGSTLQGRPAVRKKRFVWTKEEPLYSAKTAHFLSFESVSASGGLAAAA